MRCLVLLDSTSAGISNGLTYESGELAVQPGQLVLVTLRGKKAEGIVLRTDMPEPKEKEEYAVKKILAIVHPTPLLHKKQLTLLAWIATYYHCSLRQAMRVFLPSPPWHGLLPRVITEYRPAGDPEAQPRGTKQKEILALARETGMVTGDLLKFRLNATPATVKSLIEQGFLIKSEAWETASAPAARAPIENPVLTPVQEAAYTEMIADKRPTVLFGITGSGKTEIYARMIKDAIDAGGQAILLVPEILLTAHSIDRFESLVGRERIAVLHSKLTDAARRSEWKRIRNGEIALVIGSRSALFAPLPDPKLIILDEEHEWTYKNEQSPRYHARETAETYCALIGAKLVLGSATPSLESWHRALTNRYQLARLGERYLNRPVPTVRVIDLVDVNFGSLYPFSPPLLDAIKARLDKQEQSVLSPYTLSQGF
jgi:primosomal protein N' (replication factor Y)